MLQNPFATIVSVNNDEPFITHLPLTPVKAENGTELIGHCAKANPHWKLLNDKPTTIIFQGPHTYITPKWYTEDDVPTWNYSVLHVHGTATLINDHEGLVNCLKTLATHAESLWPSGWSFNIPDDLKDDHLTKHIVGFKIRIEDINLKKKLSQNRTPNDRIGILNGLSTRADEASRFVKTEMLKLYTEAGEEKE